MQINQILQSNELSRFVRLNGILPFKNAEDTIRDLDFDTILFIGSGAVENGWRPIKNLCSEIIAGQFAGLVNYGKNNSHFYNEPFDHFITSIAFLETVIRSRLARSLEDPHFSSRELFKFFGNAIATREQMAKHFNTESSLNLRKLDQAKYEINFEKTLVVTSNWDNCVWSNVAFKNVIYLHGHCRIKNSLVLPTQFVTDEFPLKYWIDLRLKQNNSATVMSNANLLIDKLKALPDYVSKGTIDTQQELNYAHDLFREAISKNNLKRLFIWGYGFNLYDAEVNMLLTMASLSCKPRIEILNPDPAVLIKAAQVLATEINELGYHHPYK